MNYDPELMLYEEPSSMDVADWERFCERMREEAQRYPDSENVRLTLQFAEQSLDRFREMWAGRPPRPPDGYCFILIPCDCEVDTGIITSAIGPESSGDLRDIVGHPPEIADDDQDDQDTKSMKD